MFVKDFYENINWFTQNLEVIDDMSEKELNSYRLTSLEEPSDEMLERIMADAAADARRRGEEADRRFFDELRERINKERQRKKMS